MRILKQLIFCGIVMATASIAAHAQDAQYTGHHGIDFNVELGPDFSLQSGGSTMFHALVEGGKKFNKNFYFGVGGGVETGGGSTSYPVFGTLRTFIPIESSRIIPTIGLRGGYAFSPTLTPSDCIFLALSGSNF